MLARKRSAGRYWVGFAGVLYLASWHAAQGDERAFELAPGCEVRFATASDARSVLSQPDRFTESLSRFDLQSRLQTANDVTTADLLAHYAAQALDWEPEEITRTRGLMQRLASHVVELRLPAPKSVLLVKSTGQDEAGAAYCRGPAIILPKRVQGWDDRRLERLIVHEFFHVLSNQNPSWREKLYRIIGFHTCPAIALPPAWRDRKITNPDAPQLDCYIELRDGEANLAATPVLYASAEQFDASAGKSFFQYLVFRLLIVQRHDDIWQPKLDDQGQPIWLDPKDRSPAAASFHEQIGDNTKYIIHPDEILADNFAHLILGSTDLPTPRIVTGMRDVFQSSDKP